MRLESRKIIPVENKLPITIDDRRRGYEFNPCIEIDMGKINKTESHPPSEMSRAECDSVNTGRWCSSYGMVAEL
jgi:hypothetical protein